MINITIKGFEARLTQDAKKLNFILTQQANQVFETLSRIGVGAYFPSGGILAQGAEAGEAQINATLGQAYEDDGSPMVFQTFQNQLNPDLHNKSSFVYSKGFGNPELRKKWQNEIRRKNPSINSLISTPIVTSGLTHGINLAMELFVNPNDKIISPDLYWENYNLGAWPATISPYTMFDKNGLNITGLENELLSEGNKKVLILNFPNNPTGYYPTIDEAENIKLTIEKAAKADKTIVVIVDDAYYGLNYEDNIYPESLFSKLANLHENVIALKIDGMTKEGFVWGLRVGFITFAWKGMNNEAMDALTKKIGGRIRARISNINTPGQIMALNALNASDYNKQFKEKSYILQARYNKVKEILGKNGKYKEYFEALPYNAGYFMCIRLKKHNADEIRRALINLQKNSVGTISVGDDILRIAYSGIPKNLIETVFESIYGVCENI